MTSASGTLLRSSNAQQSPSLDRQQVAAVEELKSEAYKALRGGQFDRTSELLTKATSLNPNDPNLSQMTNWVSQFETQRQQFASERQKEYGKTVVDVKKLLASDHFTYAASEAARAYSLAEDKDAFARDFRGKE